MLLSTLLAIAYAQEHTQEQSVVGNTCFVNGQQYNSYGSTKPEWKDTFTPLQPGTYKTKGDMVNIRDGMGTKTVVVATIPLSADVTIGTCEKQEKIGATDGCWHKVHRVTHNQKSLLPPDTTGYIFSTALTACYLQLDWDDDGTMENVFLSLSSNSEYHVRVYDPNNAPHVFWYSATNPEETGRGNISVVEKKVSGVPLVGLSLDGEEACGSTSTVEYLTYTPSTKQSIHKAISTSTYSDSPYYQVYTVEWKPNKKLIYTDDNTQATIVQEYCFNTEHTYTPCGPRKETPKEFTEE